VKVARSARISARAVDLHWNRILGAVRVRADPPSTCS
jgi:hypothetical protein